MFLNYDRNRKWIYDCIEFDKPWVARREFVFVIINAYIYEYLLSNFHNYSS